MSLINLDGTSTEAPSIPESEVEVASYVDYFGFDETHKYILPDGKQWIEFKAMNEGQRAQYEASTSRDIRFNRRTDDAAISMDAAKDRKALIETSVVGWHMVRKNHAGQFEPLPFSSGNPGSLLSQWLKVANPRIVNELVAAIRRVNDWMTEDMTSAMIREEIERLTKMLAETEEREARQKNS